MFCLFSLQHTRQSCTGAPFIWDIFNVFSFLQHTSQSGTGALFTCDIFNVLFFSSAHRAVGYRRPVYSVISVMCLISTTQMTVLNKRCLTVLQPHTTTECEENSENTVKYVKVLCNHSSSTANKFSYLSEVGFFFIRLENLLNVIQKIVFND